MGWSENSFRAALGIGFLYPRVYANTIEQAKKGKLGDELKELLDLYPDAVIDSEIMKWRNFMIYSLSMITGVENVVEAWLSFRLTVIKKKME